MDIIKKRIKERVEEIKNNERTTNEGLINGLEEALGIIKKIEKELPREAWGDY